MANEIIYPYGQGQTMPAGYPIADDLDTDSAQQALSAKQGKRLKEMFILQAGGSWLSLGTSITWYNDNIPANNAQLTKGYQTRVREVINFTSLTNNAVNGGTMGGSNGLGANVNSLVVAADYVTIEHGINDWGNGVSVGTINDFINDTGVSTFCGAYRKVIDAIYSKNANAKIIIITPRKGYGFNGFLPGHWYDDKNGKYLKDYADAAIEIAQYMSLPVCDWFNESNTNQSNLAANSKDVALHPNDTGYQKLADLLVDTFKAVM